MTSNNATNFVTMTTQNTHTLEDLWLAFGRKVRDYREKKGWSQEEAARRANMKRQQWNRIEQGASTKRATILRIADALEIDRDTALDWAGFKSSLAETTVAKEKEDREFSSYVEQAITLFNKLRDYQRKKLLRILHSIYEEEGPNTTMHTKKNLANIITGERKSEPLTWEELDQLKADPPFHPDAEKPLLEHEKPKSDEQFRTMIRSGRRQIGDIGELFDDEDGDIDQSDDETAPKIFKEEDERFEEDRKR